MCETAGRDLLDSESTSSFEDRTQHDGTQMGRERKRDFGMLK